MSYHLTSICESDTALNCDVTLDEQYLGRLYVFPTAEPSLSSLGINQQWFLAHELGDFVVSGYVSESGEWSISPHCSLEPILEFSSQSEVFNRVFSADYLREVLALREERSLDLATVVSGGSGSEDGENSSNGQSRYDAQKIPAIESGQGIKNLDVLSNLLRSSAEELEEQKSADAQDEEQSCELEEIESDAVTMPLVEPTVLVKDGLSEKEIKWQALQDVLIDRVIEEYRERELTQFVIPPFGVVTVHAEEDYFVLHSDKDGHTILAATLNGEVLDELDQSDAFELEEVLQTREAQLSGLLMRESELEEASSAVGEKMQSPSKKSKGMEYGT